VKNVVFGLLRDERGKRVVGECMRREGERYAPFQSGTEEWISLRGRTADITSGFSRRVSR
jgi:hypothetical protein